MHYRLWFGFGQKRIGSIRYLSFVYVWIIGLILLGFFCQYLQRFSKTAVVFILIVILFIAADRNGQNGFFQYTVFKFQSYGNLSGTYPSHNIARSGLTTNIDTDPEDKIFVQESEIYFLADRQNAAKIDNPTVFYSEKYQN